MNPRLVFSCLLWFAVAAAARTAPDPFAPRILAEAVHKTRGLETCALIGAAVLCLGSLHIRICKKTSRTEQWRASTLAQALRSGILQFDSRPEARAAGGYSRLLELPRRRLPLDVETRLAVAIGDHRPG